MRGKLSYANVVSTLCLFLLLAGGGAYAATKLAKNSVGTKQIKNGAVTETKISASAQAALKGQKGDQGPQGDQGQPGPATGPAGGDLSGNYPNPSLRAPDAPILAGLPDAITPNSCAGLTTNAWYNAFASGFNNAGYYRDRQGRVFLQGGLLQCGTSPPATVFTLPPGFRPAHGEVQAATSFNVVFAVGIQSNGGVQPNPAGVSNTLMSLDGISFRCAPSGQDGCP